MEAASAVMHTKRRQHIESKRPRSRADLPSASIGETQRAVLDEQIEGSLDLAHHRSIPRVETRPCGSAIETLRGFDSRRLHN
jgi:hypothetical protein